MMKSLTLALAVLAVPVLTSARLAERADEAAVREAAMNYVTGVYEAKPELIERSVSPQLTKVGFARQGGGAYRQLPMTYAQLVALSKTWNADGKQDTSVKDVKVLDVLDQTAVAKLTASWGVDYMQLAKIDGTWRILHIVWQTPPQ